MTDGCMGAGFVDRLMSRKLHCATAVVISATSVCVLVLLLVGNIWWLPDPLDDS